MTKLKRMNEELVNIFQLDIDLRNQKAYDFAFKSLKNEWNLPDEFIAKVAKNFLCATEGNIFLDILDGADDINEAWRRYCEYRGMEHEIDCNPFLEE